MKKNIVPQGVRVYSYPSMKCGSAVIMEDSSVWVKIDRKWVAFTNGPLVHE